MKAVGFLLTSALFLSSISASAAPIPSPAFSAPGAFHSNDGFSLNAGHSQWLLSEPGDSKSQMQTVYKAPYTHLGVQPALTVRTDKLNETIGLRTYVKRWLRDYDRFGLDILAAKPVKLNGNMAYLLDVSSRETNKQLRQVVFLKNKTAVILTCRDHRQHFSTSVNSCNEIIKTFRWNE